MIGWTIRRFRIRKQGSGIWSSLSNQITQAGLTGAQREANEFTAAEAQKQRDLGAVHERHRVSASGRRYACCLVSIPRWRCITVRPRLPVPPVRPCPRPMPFACRPSPRQIPAAVNFARPGDEQVAQESRASSAHCRPMLTVKAPTRTSTRDEQS